MSKPNPFARIPDRQTPAGCAQGRAGADLQGACTFILGTFEKAAHCPPQAPGRFNVVGFLHGGVAAPRALKGFGPVVHLSSSAVVVFTQ